MPRTGRGSACRLRRTRCAAASWTAPCRWRWRCSCTAAARAPWWSRATPPAHAGAQAARAAGLPLVHLEAGLRSGDVRSPFPEEPYRRAIARIADLHLAPSARAAAQLVAEGIPAQCIEQTGSTAVDGLRQPALASTLPRCDLLVDVHRRENAGRALDRLALGLRALARGGWRIGLAAHPNQWWQRRWLAGAGRGYGVALPARAGAQPLAGAGAHRARRAQRFRRRSGRVALPRRAAAGVSPPQRAHGGAGEATRARSIRRAAASWTRRSNARLARRTGLQPGRWPATAPTAMAMPACAPPRPSRAGWRCSKGVWEHAHERAGTRRQVGRTGPAAPRPRAPRSEHLAAWRGRRACRRRQRAVCLSRDCRLLAAMGQPARRCQQRPRRGGARLAAAGAAAGGRLADPRRRRRP